MPLRAIQGVFLTTFLAMGTVGPVVAAGPPPLEIPAASDESLAQLQALNREIAETNYQGAALRMDELIGDHANDLVVTPGGALASVGNVLAAMHLAENPKLMQAYAAQVDEHAETALATVEINDAAQGLDYYELALRYPWSRIVGDALAQAADLAARRGDWAAALAQWKSAQDHGWRPDTVQKSQISAVGDRVTADAQSANSAAVPTDASWYGAPDAASRIKAFPCRSEQGVMIPGPRSLACFDAGGRLIWKAIDGQSSSSTSDGLVAAPPALPCLRPVLAMADGRAAAVVVAWLKPDGRGCHLVALRAEDGRPLWDTDADAALKPLRFSTAIAVVGRYVYAFAEQSGTGRNAPSQLQVCSLNLLDGALIWQTPLGTAAHSPQDIAVRQGGMSICSDRLIIIPDAGVIGCMDRFDGRCQWLVRYPTLDAQGQQWRYSDQPMISQQTVLAAPLDSVQALALDLETGQTRWAAPDLARQTLVGTLEGGALFASDQIVAVNVGTGQAMWSARPVSRLSGPSLIRGNDLLLPTQAGLVQLNPKTGGSSAASQTVANFRALLHDPLVKTQLDEGVRESLQPPLRSR